MPGINRLHRAVRLALAPQNCLALAGALTGAIVPVSPCVAEIEPFPAVIELTSLDGSDGFALNGAAPEDRAGSGAAGAGDLNGDGIDDVIIGAGFAASGDQAAAGATYVVFGRTTGFPAQFELSSLDPAYGGDGRDGFIIAGIDGGDWSGTSVAAAGDVNGDGMDDLVIGAPHADPVGRDDAGEAYVLFGRTTGFPPVFELRSLDPAAGGDGSEGFIIEGATAGDYTGRRLKGAGDINGDGLDDLIFPAPPGRSYVLLGNASGFPAIFDLYNLEPAGGGDGSQGFVLVGNSFTGRYDPAASGCGDVNSDGVDDILIGSESEGNAGAAFVVYGRAAGFPATFALRSLYPANGGDGSMGYVLEGIDGNDNAGRGVSGAGDANGDGVADLLIGAWKASWRRNLSTGESYIVFGRSGGFPPLVELRNLQPGYGGDGRHGFILKGIGSGDKSGRIVSDAGDVNADGFGDFLIGADRAQPHGYYSGQSYLIFGRGTPFPAVFELSNLFPIYGGSGTQGFVMNGGAEEDFAGHALSHGDVNGDGFDDVIISAYLADAGGRENAGATYVIFGHLGRDGQREQARDSRKAMRMGDAR